MTDKISRKLVDKVVKVTYKSSKYYGKIGLCCYQTKQLVSLILFYEKLGEDDCMFYKEVFVSERPYKTCKLNEKYVEIISEANIDKTLLQKARAHAQHLVLGYKTTKPIWKYSRSNITYKCSDAPKMKDIKKMVEKKNSKKCNKKGSKKGSKK